MTVHQNEIHAKIVDTWESKNAQGVSPKMLPELFATAIQAVERRSRSTLSGITVSVVIDRALHEISEKYPCLAHLKIAPTGLDFSGLLRISDVTPQDMKRALREFLIELLNVFGNITADILTIPLHKELMGVTNGSSLTASVSQTLHADKSVKKNREQP